MLKVTHKQAVEIHSKAVTQLKVLVLNAPEGLRSQLRGLSSRQLVSTCGRMRRANREVEWTATVSALRATARRAQAAAAEVSELEAGIGGVSAVSGSPAARREGHRHSGGSPAAVRLVSPRPTALGSRLRGLGRGRSNSRFLRPGRPSPAESGWRPGVELRPAHGRDHALGVRPQDSRLRRSPSCPRQERSGDSALPQTLPCPPSLQTDGGGGLMSSELMFVHLTNIEASKPHQVGAMREIRVKSGRPGGRPLDGDLADSGSRPG